MRRRPLRLGVVAAAGGAAVVVAACAGSGVSATQPPPSAPYIREAIRLETDALHHLDSDTAAAKQELATAADALRKARAAGGLSHDADVDLRQALAKDENAATLVGTPNNGLVRTQLAGALNRKEAALKALGVTDKGKALPPAVKVKRPKQLPPNPKTHPKRATKPKRSSEQERRVREAVSRLVVRALDAEDAADEYFDERNGEAKAERALARSRAAMETAFLIAVSDPQLRSVAQQLWFALQHDDRAFAIYDGEAMGCFDCELDDAYDHKNEALHILDPLHLYLGIIGGGPDEFAQPSPWSRLPEYTSRRANAPLAAGTLWFSKATADQIAQVNVLTHAVKTFAIPTPNAGPEGMTIGPDGAVWFVELLAGKIGRVTAAGSFSEFPLPNPRSEPEQITTGPDGNLWFTEIDGNAIGRITPAGALTEFPLPQPRSTPLSIVGTPDGHVWFTEGAGRLGRMTMDGAVDLELTLPGGDTFPTSITYGPDRRLWFTELHANQLGRVGLDGRGLQTWTIPSPNSFPLTITPGPDRASLWFTERSTNKLGRITIAGRISEQTIPSRGPLDLVGAVAGPGRRVWFTGFRSGALGSIRP